MSEELNPTIGQNLLTSSLQQFQYYKMLGEKAMAQVSDEGLFWQPHPESNSIALIVQHLAGNMHSRWTDFLTTDGEKSWRNRDAEFEPSLTTREEVLSVWEAGWNVVFAALQPLTENDLLTIIYIRNQGHTVADAILRQLAHYPYHIGQMIFIAKIVSGDAWQSLSIPKGGSQGFNNEKFAQEKRKVHFTETEK